jgi:hypothetical protein
LNGLRPETGFNSAQPDVGGISCEVLSGLVTLIIFKKINNKLPGILFKQKVRLSVVEAPHEDDNRFFVVSAIKYQQLISTVALM